MSNFATFDFSEALPDSYIFESGDQLESTSDPILGPGKAIVGEFRRGPINTPQKVNSWGEFVSWFGDVYSGSLAPDHVRMFFENAQNNLKAPLYVVRTAHMTNPADKDTVDAVKASVNIDDSTGTNAEVTSSNTETFAVVATTADTLVLSIDGGADITIVLTAGATQSALDIVNEINTALDGEDVIASDVGGAIVLTHSQYGVAKTIEIGAGSDAALLTELGFTAGTTAGTDGVDTLKIEAIDEGAWGNNLSVTLSYNTDGSMNLVISGDGKTENFNELELIEDTSDPSVQAQYFITRLNNEDRESGSTEIRVSLLKAIASGTITADRPREGVYALTSGSNGTAVDRNDVIGDIDEGTGMYGLDGVEEPTDWICPEFETDYIFVSSAQSFGASTLKRNFIFSFASGKGVSTAITERNSEGWNTKLSAAYWLQINSSYNNKDLSGSGAVLGLYAYADRTKGVWQSPSGVDMKIVGVNKIHTLPTSTQAGKLNGNGICYAFTVAGSGTVLWGGRTLFQGKKWRYIVSARDFMVIEHNLRKDGLSGVHKNNDSQLWGSLYQNGKALLRDWWERGGLIGTSESQAFYIKCDKETNPKTVTDNGIVRRFVRVRVPKIAEFVVTIIDQEV